MFIRLNKFIICFVIMAMFLVFVTPIYSSSVSLEGQIVQGRFLVPMRGIFEALGATVHWDGDTRTVTGTKGDISVKLTIDSKITTVNNKKVELDVPATVIEGRTFVPARFISESLGANVEWDGERREAIITGEEIRIVVKESITIETPKGQEILYREDGTIRYVGEVKDGEPHGQGTVYREDGTISYKGEFKDGEPHGKGTQYYPDGTIAYKGEYKYFKKHGQGTMYWPDGTVAYEGGYQAGEMHGQGRMYDEDGTIRYEGQWKDGEMDGQGRVYDNGKIGYEGGFKNGIMHGQGVLYREDGTILFKGEFIYGVPVW